MQVRFLSVMCPPLYLHNHSADFKSEHGFGTLSSRRERKTMLKNNRRKKYFRIFFLQPKFRKFHGSLVDEAEGRDTYVGRRPSEGEALATRAKGAVGTRSASLWKSGFCYSSSRSEIVFCTNFWLSQGQKCHIFCKEQSYERCHIHL